MSRKFTGDRLVIASHNKGKVREYADILGDLGIDWLTLDEAGAAEFAAAIAPG